MTLCDRCLKKLQVRGKVLHSAIFDSSIRHKHKNNYRKGIIYALCDDCYMNIEQAKELECNRWMLVNDEARVLNIDPHDRKYVHFFNAIKAWGEALADLRMRGTAEERMTAAAEATQRYVTEKRN